MWFSLVCILVDNDMRHHSGQNVVDSRGAAEWVQKSGSYQITYYISQLLRALWLVNLAGRILLYDPLNVKAVFVAKMFRDLSPSIPKFYSK